MGKSVKVFKRVKKSLMFSMLTFLLCLFRFCWFFSPFLWGETSLLMAFTFRTLWNFLLHVCSSSPLLCSTSLILSGFSPYYPYPFIVPSGLVAVARAVFTLPEWKAEGQQGSNSPSALGVEEMHGSMAGIPEPPQSKETPEWWVEVVRWDRTGLSPLLRAWWWFFLF